MARSDKIYDHKKSGQLRRRRRNRIKTELIMMMMKFVLPYYVILSSFCAFRTHIIVSKWD